MDSIPYSSNKEYDSDSMSQPENDKTLDLARAEEVTAELGDVGKKHTAIVDLAAKAHVEAVQYTQEESKSVLRKIDWHLMPMLVWICTWRGDTLVRLLTSI
jgi:hypothetical protein